MTSGKVRIIHGAAIVSSLMLVACDPAVLGSQQVTLFVRDTKTRRPAQDARISCARLRRNPTTL